LKSGRIEKDARSKVVEGSPSAKGTLDNYLVNSKDDNRGRGLLVKRSLALGIDEVSNEEKEESFVSGRLCVGSCEGGKEVQKEMSQGSSGNVGNIAVERVVKGCLDLGNGVENSELKQFATDFLSLYCG